MTGSDIIPPAPPTQIRDVCGASGERCPKPPRLPIHVSKCRVTVVKATNLSRDIVALAALNPCQGSARPVEPSSQMRARTIQRP
jgi:hypothetical protein